MNRFFLAKNQISGDEVHFPADIAHQILNVLRLGEGDEVEVLDNKGQIYRVCLKTEDETDCLIGQIVSKEAATSEPTVRISLCFGMSNRDKVELILQKATEVGVSAFYPFVSSRTLVQSTSLPEKKISRWERIIREAAEQSRRGRIPHLHQPVTLEACVRRVKDTHSYLLAAWEAARESQTDRLEALQFEKVDGLALFVGPEAGFSSDEIDLILQSGGNVVSLGQRVLRMETAAIVFPALMLHLMGEM